MLMSIWSSFSMTASQVDWHLLGKPWVNHCLSGNGSNWCVGPGLFIAYLYLNPQKKYQSNQNNTSEHASELEWQGRSTKAGLQRVGWVKGWVVHHRGRWEFMVHYTGEGEEHPCSLTTHCRISVCKSGLKTAKRPQPDWTKTGKDRTSSPVFWFLRIKDHKKTGLHGPVFAV